MLNNELSNMKKLILTAFAACLSVLPAMSQDAEWSRDLKDFASTPKVGGYVIGKYAYTSKDGEKSDNSFSQRLVRLYVDGSILTDFKYRVQVQINNDKFHMKDYYVEWAHWKEFSVKVGQYKRAFLFENPYNPWNVGFGDYSQITKMFSGMGDYCGEPSSTGGRDQGIQFQGDLFPNANGRRVFHYQIGVYNGEGVNTKDYDNRKDIIGGIWVMPIKGLRIGAFGWTGSRGQMLDPITNKTRSVEKNRYAISAEYDLNGYTFRAEYLHSQGWGSSSPGNNVREIDYTKGDKADGWYVFGIVPLVKGKLFAKARYQCYRNQKEWGTSVNQVECGLNYNFTKNLEIHAEYSHVNDRNLAEGKHNYNLVDVELDFRF